MKILMFLENHYPPDVRVEKEARTLVKAGHEVFLLCPRREDMPSQETVGGVEVMRVPLPRGIVWRAWVFLWFTLFVVNPFWRKHLSRIVKELGIQVLHIHDLPMVKTGLGVARRFRIPVVADLHENYPVLIRVSGSKLNWRGRVVNRIRRWEQIERLCVRRADRVVSVGEEAREHYVHDCGIPPEKVVAVMNTEDPDYLRSLPVDHDLVEGYQAYFVISYIGGFGLHRGVETAISAMPKIIQAIPGARLLLVGSGKNQDELKALAVDEGVQDAVEFTGQQPFSLVPSYIAASRVCLIPYIASEQTDASCPHKLFQYMAMGKPVVVSSMRSLGRIVSDTAAGLVYVAGSAESLAEAVVRIHGDNGLADRLGEAGRKAVEEQYNWAIEGEKLLALYQGLR